MSDFNSKHNRFVWVDIPVVDLDRASVFYSAVLGCKVHRQESDGISFCVIDSSGGNSGCLVPAESEIASAATPLVYLNVNGRIRDAVLQVEKNGGKIVQRIHTISPHGFRAVILDSEGNRIALHSTTDV